MQKHSEDVCILLGVWGEKFIHYFLDLSLASLLAPGNLPALSQEYRTRFIFLTRSIDIDVFKNHPAYARLEQVCTIEFISINDLIVIGNYSTTLTLAYDRGIRAQGNAMLNTYFIFLTSDYIFADGAFQGLMRYMQKGYSGIQAGNFQVIQEEMESYLLAQIDPDTHVLQIKPRELLAESLKHLHPMTVASFVDQNMMRNHLANRFFCYQDGVIAGRFYLLHMLCIKPETIDYQIGASCDYSFIPEMCPSGNIATMTDSDDYLVIEIQPKGHELENISTGMYNPNLMSKALAEWTTTHHRENATQTIFYHSTELSVAEKQNMERKLLNFLQPINIKLTKYRPKPYRNHPFWLGAINSHQSFLQRLHGVNHENINYYEFLSLNSHSRYKELFFKYFGRPPQVFRWHYRWREYATTINELNTFIGDKKQNTLAVFDSYFLSFLRYSQWLYQTHNIRHNYNAADFLKLKKGNPQLLQQQFERCLLSFTVKNVDKFPTLLKEISSMLTPNAEILVLIPNDKNSHLNSMYDIQHELFCQMNYFINPEFAITKITPIYDNLSFMGAFAIHSIARRYNYSKKRRIAFFLAFGIPGSLIAVARNLLSRRKNAKKSGHCTNILLQLERQKSSQEVS